MNIFPIRTLTTIIAVTDNSIYVILFLNLTEGCSLSIISICLLFPTAGVGKTSLIQAYATRSFPTEDVVSCTRPDQREFIDRELRSSHKNIRVPKKQTIDFRIPH